MQYLLMIYGNEAGMLAAPKEMVTQMSAAYGAYTEAMKKAGVWVGGERLRPTSDATTVRVKDGKTQVLDGPYAETKEQLGGYYMIEVPDLDAALTWAARCPAASHDREASRTAKECHRDAARRGPRAAPHRGEGRGAPPRARASRCGARVREPCARQAADRVFQGAEGGTLGRTEPDHRDGIAAGSQRIGDDHDRHLWTPRARGPARCREPHRTGSVC